MWLFVGGSLIFVYIATIIVGLWLSRKGKEFESETKTLGRP